MVFQPVKHLVPLLPVSTGGTTSPVTFLSPFSFLFYPPSTYIMFMPDAKFLTSIKVLFLNMFGCVITKSVGTFPVYARKSCTYTLKFMGGILESSLQLKFAKNCSILAKYVDGEIHVLKKYMYTCVPTLFVGVTCNVFPAACVCFPRYVDSALYCQGISVWSMATFRSTRMPHSLWDDCTDTQLTSDLSLHTLTSVLYSLCLTPEGPRCCFVG